MLKINSYWEQIQSRQYFICSEDLRERLFQPVTASFSVYLMTLSFHSLTIKMRDHTPRKAYKNTAMKQNACKH